MNALRAIGAAAAFAESAGEHRIAANAKEAQVVAAEMLEACETLLAAMNEDAMMGGMLLGCAIEIAKSAVAKAAGVSA